MTGITAELREISTLAHSIDRTAETIGSGINKSAVAAMFALPQASRFRTALEATREKQAVSAQSFSRFYHDAGVSLTRLGHSLSEGEDAASGAFELLSGAL